MGIIPIQLTHDRAIKVFSKLGLDTQTQAQIDLMESVISIMVKKQAQLTYRLSRREYECLHWTAQGYTSKQIANRLGINVTTVNSYKRTVLRKLNCSTMIQAVVKGVRTGLLMV